MRIPAGVTIQQWLHTRRGGWLAKAIVILLVLLLWWIVSQRCGDHDLPTITATTDPPPNAAGWHNTPVTMRFDCADNTSGIATCPEPITVTTEGADQVITGTAVDNAGNEGTVTVTLNIDTTPPGLSALLDPSPNPHGWNRSEVTVSFEATDALSGVDQVTPAITLTTEGANQQVTGTATDRAGNTATTSATVNLDTTPPLITASVDPGANAHGWHNSDPTVTYRATDSLSGVESVSPDVVVTTQGANQIITGTAVDYAGNEASASATINLDKTPPTIDAAVTPAANAHGWHNTDPTVQFNAMDTLSGVATVTPPVLVSTEGSAQVVGGTAVDAAGNTASTSVTINLDKTLPALLANVTPTPTAHGWNNTDVTVIFEASDALSGIEAVTAPSTLTDEGAGQVVSGTATDLAGNSRTTSATVNLDRTSPDVTITYPADGVTVTDPEATVQGTVSDGLSDVDKVTCNGNAASVDGAAFAGEVFLAEGSNTLVAEATDKAGNAATASITVTLDTTPSHLDLFVQPPVSPTFLPSQVISGTVGPEEGPPPEEPQPLVASLTTTEGRQAETLEVGIQGQNTHFQTGLTQVTFGPGITVTSVTVQNLQAVTVRIAIAEDAGVGPRLVAISSGREEALLGNAFHVLPGLGTVSGQLVDADGDPIVRAQVCVSGTDICTTTDDNGNFTLDAVPTTATRLVITAPGYDPLSVSIGVEVGGAVRLGEIAVVTPLAPPPPPPDPGAPPLPAELARLLGRNAGDTVGGMSFPQAQRLVAEAILVVGGTEAGVLDEAGNQRNPEIDGDGEISLINEGVNHIARRVQRGDTVSLGEILFAFSIGLEWSPGPPLTLQEWINGMQDLVDQAWADPDDPDHKLPILMLNRGRTLLREPPVLSPYTRLNALQGYVLVASLLTTILTPESEPVQAGSVPSPVRLAAATGNVLSDISPPWLLVAQAEEPPPSPKPFTRLWRNFFSLKQNFLTSTLIGSVQDYFLSQAHLLLNQTIRGLNLQLPIAGRVAEFLEASFGLQTIAQAIPAAPEITKADVRTGDDGQPRVAVQVKRSTSDPKGDTDDPKKGMYAYRLDRFRTSDAAREPVPNGFMRPAAEDTREVLTLTDSEPGQSVTWFYAATAIRGASMADLDPQGVLQNALPWWSFPLFGIYDPMNQVYGKARILVSDYSNPVVVSVGPSGADIRVNAIEVHPDPKKGEVYYNSESVIFEITEKSLKELKSENVPDDVLKKLEDIKDQKFKKEEDFLDILKETIEEGETDQYKSKILKYAKENIYPIMKMTGTPINNKDISDFVSDTFPDPGQKGLAIDSQGNLYTAIAASEAKFGGMIEKFLQPSGDRELAGRVNYYSRSLGSAYPVSVGPMAIGPAPEDGAEPEEDLFLFVVEELSGQVRRVKVSDPSARWGAGPRYADIPAIFKITEQTLEKLRSEGVPAAVLKNLNGIKNKEVIGEKAFLKLLTKTIGEKQTDQYKSLILKYAKIPFTGKVLDMAFDAKGQIHLLTSALPHEDIHLADLDIDSDNTNGLDPYWLRTFDEENLEEDAEKPGKLIAASAGDADGDGIPDYADDSSVGLRFTPMILEIAPSLDLARAKIKFVYSESDPAQLKASTDTCLYPPPKGHLRVWTVERFNITEQSLEKLQSEGVPAAVLAGLEGIKDQKVIGEKAFLELLTATIGEAQTAQYKSLILKYAVSRETRRVEDDGDYVKSGTAYSFADLIPDLDGDLIPDPDPDLGPRQIKLYIEGIAPATATDPEEALKQRSIRVHIAPEGVFDETPEDMILVSVVRVEPPVLRLRNNEQIPLLPDGQSTVTMRTSVQPEARKGHLKWEILEPKRGTEETKRRTDVTVADVSGDQPCDPDDPEPHDPKGYRCARVTSKETEHEPGWITVRVYDEQLPSASATAELNVGCQACQGGTCSLFGGGRTEMEMGIDAQFSLGRTAGGKSAGWLAIQEEDMGPDLATTKALHGVFADDVTVTRCGDNTYRQILTPEGLADIVTRNDLSYDISFYPVAQVGAKIDDLYTFTGEPSVKWQITNPSGYSHVYNELWIDRIASDPIRAAYAWNDTEQTWTLTTGNGLRQETRDIEWIDPGVRRVETTSITDATGELVSKQSETYQVYSWGEELVQRVLDPDGDALTTAYTYYTNLEQTWTYGKLQTVTEPTGASVTYEYNMGGRRSRETRTWLDNQTRSTQYGYQSVAPDLDDLSESPHLPRLVEETINGTTVAKTYHVYYRDAASGERVEITERAANAAAPYGDPGNLSSEMRFYAPTAPPEAADRPKLTVQPDGQQAAYTYEAGDYVADPDPGNSRFVPRAGGQAWRESVVNGTVQSPAGVAFKTTQDVTVYDPLGRVVIQESYVYDGASYDTAHPINRTVTSYDDSEQTKKVIHPNGLVTESTWGCCDEGSETDTQGITYTYLYDDLQRVERRTKYGIAADDYPAQKDLITTYVYEERTQRTITSADGMHPLTTSTTNDLVGRIEQQVDEAGLVTAYAYSNNGLETVITRPGGSVEITTRYLDSQTKSVAIDGVLQEYYEYGVNSQDGSQWTTVYQGPDGVGSPRWTTTTTDVLGRVVRIKKPAFGSGTVATQNHYNALGQLMRIEQPGMADTLYEYDALGQQTRSGLDVNHNGTLDLAGPDRIDESVVAFKMVDGDLWQISQSLVYAGENNATATTTATVSTRLTGLSPGQAQESVATDIHGNATTRITAVDIPQKKSTQSTAYPDSTAAAVDVTVNGLRQSSRSTTGLETTYAYDAFGRQVWVTDPRTGESRTHYNDQGQVDYVEDAAGYKTSYAYKPETGRLIAVTDARNKVQRFDHDTRGRLAKTWGDAVYPVSYTYDDYGNMLTMTTYRQGQDWTEPSWPQETGIGDVTTWDSDPVTGFLTSKGYADQSAVTYTYTPEGKLATRTWARNVVTTYSYDPDTGELTDVNYSDTAMEPDIAYTYDRLGRRKTVTDAVGSRTFTYDTTSLHLDAETISGLYNRTITRKYETSGIVGRSTGFAMETEYDVTYEYDPASGRFESVTWHVAGQPARTVSYGYVEDSDLIGQITEAQSGLTSVRDYEPQRDLVTQVQNRVGASPIVSQFDYKYDAVGRQTSVVNTGKSFQDPAFNFYGYNDRSEVESVNRYLGIDPTDFSSPVPEENFGYGFDNIGNRTESTAWYEPEGEARQTTYLANELNQYDTVTPPTGQEDFQYDADGNLVSDAEMTYRWNGENRLIEIESLPSVPDAEKIKLEFEYDYLGRRVEKKTFTWDAEQWTLDSHRKFLYDGWNLIAEYDENNNPIREYTWGPDVSGTVQGAGGVGGLLSIVDHNNSKVYYAVYDDNGNITSLVDSAGGDLAAKYKYSPFGNTILSAGTYADANPFRFSTKYLDSETDLYYYGYRFYSPSLGWISRDPIEELGSVNLYTFVRNNPPNQVDTLGDNDYPGGHHYAVHAIWKDWPKGSPAREVFKDCTMKPVVGHKWDLDHSKYSKAVVHQWNRFKARNGITRIPNKSQANRFLRLIRNSKNPAIQGYLRKIRPRFTRAKCKLAIRPKGRCCVTSTGFLVAFNITCQLFVMENLPYDYYKQADCKEVSKGIWECTCPSGYVFDLPESFFKWILGFPAPVKTFRIKIDECPCFLCRKDLVA